MPPLPPPGHGGDVVNTQPTEPTPTLADILSVLAEIRRNLSATRELTLAPVS